MQWRSSDKWLVVSEGCNYAWRHPDSSFCAIRLWEGSQFLRILFVSFFFLSLSISLKQKALCFFYLILNPWSLLFYWNHMGMFSGKKHIPEIMLRNTMCSVALERKDWKENISVSHFRSIRQTPVWVHSIKIWRETKGTIGVASICQCGMLLQNTL